MSAENKDKPFKAINVGKGQIVLTKYPKILQLRPVELYMKEDGSVKDEPSFAIVMIDPYGITTPVVGQLTLEMWNEAFKELGYEIVKKQK